MLDPGGGGVRDSWAVASFYDESRARTGGSGGAIKFDADGVDTVIKRLKGLVAGPLQDTGDHAQRLENMKDAGHYVGDFYAAEVRRYGGEYNEWRKKYIEAIKKTIATLEGVKQKYANIDDEAARAFGQGMND